MTTSTLTALALSCSLKPSPAASSSDLIGRQVLDAFADLGISGELVRVADFVVTPGVETDMGGEDEWPELRKRVLAADIVVMAVPTWMGHASSIAQAVLERLDAELSESDAQGRPLTFGKVAIVAVVGNEDGAHKVTADIYQALNDVGFTLPAQGGTYWNGAAMQKTDYADLSSTPKETASATAVAVANAAHLAGLLKQGMYPAVK